MSFELKNNYKTYVEYLEDAGCKLQPYLIETIKNSRLSFEEAKHADVDKYLYDLITKYSKNPGKMHRPLTLIASYLACGGSVDELDSVAVIACSIEHFQTAALIHDDIADGGKLRRGKPCMHITEGEGLAINAGDFGLAMTVGNLITNMKSSKYNEKKILDIVEKLIYMEYMTIEGQAMDLGWARDNRFDISPDDYLCMATKKSAYYSAMIPCVIGAICADTGADVLDALNDFGLKVGLAFQIQDDVLNLVENKNSKKVKDFRSDITEGKRTLIISYALSSCDDENKKRLLEILESGQTDDKVLEEAVNILETCGAILKSIDSAKRLIDEAKIILSKKLDDSM